MFTGFILSACIKGGMTRRVVWDTMLHDKCKGVEQKSNTMLTGEIEVAPIRRLFQG